LSRDIGTADYVHAGTSPEHPRLDLKDSQMTAAVLVSLAAIPIPLAILVCSLTAVLSRDPERRRDARRAVRMLVCRSHSVKPKVNAKARS
jgi:hypothetical protein